MVATRLVAVRLVMVASVEVRVSMTPVVKWPRTEKIFVDVAFVVEAFVEKKFVLVASVGVGSGSGAWAGGGAVVGGGGERAPPMPTLPVTVALAAVRAARSVVPETERPVAETEVLVIVLPLIEEFEMATLSNWSILLLWATTWYVWAIWVLLADERENIWDESLLFSCSSFLFRISSEMPPWATMRSV